MNEENPFGTGAHESEIDPRTVKHADMAVAISVPLSGGYDYTKDEIENQHRVGICTGISDIQNREKANGKKYSPDFQYLLQKKFIDFNWTEGSSILSALKVMKNYGLLPASEWTHTTEMDRNLSYDQYIAKLQAIPDGEITRLLTLCVDKIAGYAQVDVSDPQLIARAIIDSEAGILCRYPCQKNWWTPSWSPADIDPLRNGVETSGHAIVMQSYDYTSSHMQMLANTWGIDWCLEGKAHINWDNYPPTEAWIITRTTPVIPPYIFTKTLKFGDRGFDVKMLQQKLKITADGIFGNQTLNSVKSFQSFHNLVVDGIVGPKTNEILNTL